MSKKNREIKRLNLVKGEEDLEILVALGFSVEPLSTYHFRVNDTLDVWPSSKRFWDRKNFIKGSYVELKIFVQNHFNGQSEVSSPPKEVR